MFRWPALSSIKFQPHPQLAAVLLTLGIGLAVLLLAGCDTDYFLCEFTSLCDEHKEGRTTFSPSGTQTEYVLYIVYTSSGVYISGITGPDGIVREGSDLFNDIAGAFYRSENRVYSRDDSFDAQSQDGVPKTLVPHASVTDTPIQKPTVYFLSTGARLRTFDPVRNVIDTNIQFTCTDTLEGGNDLEISQDGSVGVMVTLGLTTKQYCAVVFDPVTYAITKKILIPQPYVFRRIQISPDGKTAYVNTDLNDRISNTSTIFKLNLLDGTIAPFVDVKPAGRSMAMTPDGKRLFLYGTSLSVVEIASETVFTTSLPKPSNLNVCDAGQLAMHPNGTKLYLIGSFTLNNPLCIVDTSTATLSKQVFPFPDSGAGGISPQNRGRWQFSPDGRILAMMGQANEVVLWDTETDTVLKRLPLPATGGVNPSLNFFFVPQ